MVVVHHIELGLVEGGICCHFRIIHILHLHMGALSALASVSQHFSQTEDSLAEITLANRVGTLDGLVTDLVLLENSHTAPLTNNIHKVAIV